MMVMKTIIESGAKIKSRNVVHPIWMKELQDEKKYWVIKLETPFGISDIAAVPICPVCDGFSFIDLYECETCSGSGIEKQ